MHISIQNIHFRPHFNLLMRITVHPRTEIILHKKRNFPLSISSVNVTKSQETVNMVTYTEQIIKGKFHFLYSVRINFNPPSL